MSEISRPRPVAFAMLHQGQNIRGHVGKIDAARTDPQRLTKGRFPAACLDPISNATHAYLNLALWVDPLAASRARIAAANARSAVCAALAAAAVAAALALSILANPV